MAPLRGLPMQDQFTKIHANFEEAVSFIIGSTERAVRAVGTVSVQKEESAPVFDFRR
jgi:hypothetical protein